MSNAEFHDSRRTFKHSVALYIRRLRYGQPKTKVFCVGLQKTGTTSLQYALSLMGYRVAGTLDANPYPNPDALLTYAYSLLPRFDAFADNPWPLYFREFDAMFPDAKFIMTNRDPDEWYSSVCKHFGESSSKMRSWVYGEATPIGNRQAYVDRLVAHQEAVRAHFASRPWSLLEFDVTKGHGWVELCDFLHRPIPQRAFPELNTAAMRKSRKESRREMT